MGNLRPAFAAQLESAATAFGVELRWVSDRWIALLRQDSRNAAVVGYTFPLNNAAAAELANDKVAAFEMLCSGGIPAVEHALVRFEEGSAVADSSAESQMVAPILRAPVVVKPLGGRGGKGVRRVVSDHDISRELAVIARSHRAAAVSPWVDIDAEVRLVLLDGVVLLAFCKERPENPSDDEWRHNLRFGAFPVIWSPLDVPVALSNCARSAAAMLGLRFAAVDLVFAGGIWKVMEINSGVCLERFSATSTRHYVLAEEVYACALSAMFQ